MGEGNELCRCGREMHGVGLVSRGGCCQREIPEASCGRSGTGEDNLLVVGDDNTGGGEGCLAAGVAELSDGDKGDRGKVREYVDNARGGGETGDVELGDFRGVDDRAVRHRYGNAEGSGANVDEGSVGIRAHEMACGACVGHVVWDLVDEGRGGPGRSNTRGGM